MSSNTDIEELRKAIRNDFHSLLVKEFTADWKIQRMVHDCEIDVMDFDNVNKFIQQKVIEAEMKQLISTVKVYEIYSHISTPFYINILKSLLEKDKFYFELYDKNFITDSDINNWQAQLNHNKKGA